MLLLKTCLLLFPVGPDIECSTIVLHEGETLEDKCRVTGNPTPYVEWLKEGRLVNLTVPLRRNDAGMFLVKAEGRTLLEKTIQVDVLCEGHIHLYR